MRNVWIKTDVTTEPVTIAEAKLFCKVTGTGDNALFATLIPAARENLEAYCGVSIAEKTLYAEWNKLPSDGLLVLPYGPVKSITSVKTIDEEGVEDTLSLNTEYYVNGTPWPTLRVASFWSTRVTRLRIEYIVGYGATGCPPLPYPLKVALMKEILTQYDMRENISTEAVSDLSNDAKSLASQYRRALWFGRDA